MADDHLVSPPATPIPNRLPVLPLPYPLVLHPALLLSIPLSYAHSLSLLKAALQLTSDDTVKPNSSNNKANNANASANDNKPIIVACVPTLRVPAGSTSHPLGPTRKVAGPNNKPVQPNATVIQDDEDGRVRINDLYDWGCAARLVRLTRDSASQTCTLLVTGLTRIRVDRWLSVRAPLTHTALDAARNLTLPDVPVPLAAVTAFTDDAPWPSSPPDTPADLNHVRELKSASLDLIDAIAILASPLVAADKPANSVSRSATIPGPGLPLLPPALLKRLRAFVRDARDGQAGLLADVVVGTLGGACEWSSRVQVLGDWDQKERVRHAASVLRSGTQRVCLARELLASLPAGINPNSKSELVRAQLETLLTQLAALNPNMTARITTSTSSLTGSGSKSNRADSESSNPNKPIGIISIRPSNSDSNSRAVIKPPSNNMNNPFSRGSSGNGNSNGANNGADAEDDEDEVAELSRKLDVATLTPEARKVCDRELKRLARIPPQSVERGVIITYLETMVELPWERSSADAAVEEAEAAATGPARLTAKQNVLKEDEPLVARARRILDEDHYGLEKIKKRLVEYLAVLELKTEQAEERVKQEDVEEREASKALAAADRRAKIKAKQRRGPTPPGAPSEAEIASQDEGDFEHLEDLAEEETVRRKKAEEQRKRRQRAQVADKGPILLLVGPPGTGKTSIARSLATALRRPFTRLSLGGVRDEAEIRGHRRTYVGAMPGNIVSSLRKVRVCDPVVLLDEVDKLGSGNGLHGDPMAAMLEVLDPEQNNSFNDHYINCPIDLSKVLFIATANSLDTISPPLLDRTEVIHVSGYTHDEKVAIARSFLLPKQRKAQGLGEKDLVVGDDVLLKVAMSYTREAGVRSLEREVSAIARSKAVEFAESRKGTLKDDKGRKKAYDPVVRVEDLERILGPETYEPEVAERESRPGVATGLAYQGSGSGGILHIESILLPPGQGNLKLTGSLGDVIRESAELAFSWVKAHAYQLGIVGARDASFPSHDVHLHLPGGAVPKDGPSAGVAMTCALVGLFTRTGLSPRLAMTGEITLRGKVTPVGGIKEKLLGAHRAGITRILLPVRNRKDVEADLPKHVREELDIVYVANIWQALDAAFGMALFEHVVGDHEGVREGRRLMMELEDSRL